MFDLHSKKTNQQHTSQNLAALFSKYLWCLAMRKSFLNLCYKSNCIVTGHFLLYEKLNQKFNNVFLIPDYSIESNILHKHIYEQQSIEKINIFWEKVENYKKQPIEKFKFLEDE